MWHPMKHGGCSCGSASAGPASGFGQPPFMSVPAPMAVFGAIIAFMFGMTLGMKLAEKRRGGAMPMRCGPSAGMHGHAMSGPWDHRPGMGPVPPHHHHGKGAPPCSEEHSAD